MWLNNAPSQDPWRGRHQCGFMTTTVLGLQLSGSIKVVT